MIWLTGLYVLLVIIYQQNGVHTATPWDNIPALESFLNQFQSQAYQQQEKPDLESIMQTIMIAMMEMVQQLIPSLSSA